MNKNKDHIYKYFDTEGIPFSKMMSLNFCVNETTGGVINTSESKLFIKIKTPFDFLEEEINQIVIDYIKDTTGIDIVSVNHLPKYLSVNGKPFLVELQPDLKNHLYHRYILPWRNIMGDVFFRGDKGYDYKELSGIKNIDGDLSIYNSKLESLGVLENIKGNFIFSVSRDQQLNEGTKLKTLTPLKNVGGNLIIRGGSITSLGSLNYVQGNVSLRYSQVKDVGDLKYVGGNLLISRYNLDYMNIKDITVKGKIRIYNDPRISPFI